MRRLRPAALGRRLGLARVETVLEIAADVLPAREHGIVVDAPRRELDEPYVLVAVAMAAGVRCGLVEGPQAVTLALSPHSSGTPTRRTARRKPGSLRVPRSLR